MAGTSRAGSRTGASSTRTTPFAKAVALSRAASIASRVFPDPPAPVRTSRRTSSRRRSTPSSLSSRSRPRSGFGGTGKVALASSVASGGGGERRVVLEDALLQVAELGSRLQSELVVQTATGVWCNDRAPPTAGPSGRERASPGLAGAPEAGWRLRGYATLARARRDARARAPPRTAPRSQRGATPPDAPLRRARTPHRRGRRMPVRARVQARAGESTRPEPRSPLVRPPFPPRVGARSERHRARRPRARARSRIHACGCGRMRAAPCATSRRTPAEGWARRGAGKGPRARQ